ncbi:hypothetical protein MKW98_028981 [Papaver atlanticum]|uniref:peptidylprolyl isomerase n=1 Tax=Papaver atlanticum TaxID=357466 RepID=A0AAD4TIE6_9MAGN|nr:hypothetical protein MKW98_028981 [Papaver atlanticum]
MASSSSSLLLPSGPTFNKRSVFIASRGIGQLKIQSMTLRCLSQEFRTESACPREYEDQTTLIKRRDMIGLALSIPSLVMSSSDAKGAGLPPEEKPRLCDAACEKELENAPMVTTESGLQYKDIIVGRGPTPPTGFQVAANYVAMVPSGQIFDSSLEKGLPYIFRVGSGQVIKGLDEGLLTMQTGGKRRLYIPGPLAFPKGLVSAPGRPRVAANSPVVFDVSLEYIPGLEADEE